MAENRWLLAENELTSFAVESCLVKAVITGARMHGLPYAAKMVAGFFIHEERLIPVVCGEGTGFSSAASEFLVCEIEGNLLALPVRRLAGVRDAVLESHAGTDPGGMTAGKIVCGEETVNVLDLQALYKHLGLI